MIAKTRTLGIECARNQCTQQIRTKLDLREKEGAEHSFHSSTFHCHSSTTAGISVLSLASPTIAPIQSSLPPPPEHPPLQLGETVNTGFAAIDAKFEGLSKRVDTLAGDVAALPKLVAQTVADDAEKTRRALRDGTY